MNVSAMSSAASHAPAAARRGSRGGENDPQDVVFYQPSFQDVHLGGIPYDYVDSNPDAQAPTVTCSDNACAALPNEVHRSLPVLNDDGTPKMDVRHLHFDPTPLGPVKSFALYGAIGATAGATLGLLAGSLLGSMPLGAAGGAVIVGVLAGGGGIYATRNVRHELQWDVRPLHTETLSGYKETVTAAPDQGDGMFRHHFTPILEPVDLGTYKIPHIVNAGEHHGQGGR